MAEIKKYLSDNSLNTLVDKIKSEDAKALKTAKEYAEQYAESLSTNYDSAGSATTAEQNAKSYTDTKLADYYDKTEIDSGFATKEDAQHLFIAEYGITSYEDIKAAYDAGKTCICYHVYNNATKWTLLLTSIWTGDTEAMIYFDCQTYTTNLTYDFTSHTTVWGEVERRPFENSMWKKDSINGWENNATYYPSCKAVADYVTSQIGAFLNSSS